MNHQLFHAPVQPLDSDERYTPRWIFDHLNLEFDCDPCSPLQGGDCVPASTKYTIEDDGLTQPWTGTVWVNPPFANATAWARRFIDHNNGLFLGPFANAAWTQDILAASDLVWLCLDIRFTHPTHAGKHSSMPLAFYAIGTPASEALQRLACSGVHRGQLVQRFTH